MDEINIEKTAGLLNLFDEVSNVEYPAVNQNLSYIDGLTKGHHNGWDVATTRQNNRFSMALFNILSNNNILFNRSRKLSNFEIEIMSLYSYLKNYKSEDDLISYTK